MACYTISKQIHFFVTACHTYSAYKVFYVVTDIERGRRCRIDAMQGIGLSTVAKGRGGFLFHRAFADSFSGGVGLDMTGKIIVKR
jgi:hypothetical protein